MGLRSSKYPWKIEREKMLEKQNNKLCPNEYLSQWILVSKTISLRIKKDSVKLIKYKIFYFDIFKRNAFELIISQYLFHQETIELKKLGDSPLFWPRAEWICFSFTTDDEAWLALESETHSLWNCAGFFLSLPCPHGTLELFARLLTSVLYFMLPSWPHLLGKCCQAQKSSGDQL